MKRQREFLNLKHIEEMSFVECTSKFNSLGRCVQEFMANEKLKLLRFWDGLLGRIQCKMDVVRSYSYAEIYEIATSVKGDIQEIW